jgi:hypothetical protein
MRMARPACKFTQAQLRNWKLVEHFRSVLLPRLEALPKTRTERDPRRKLAADTYFSLFLLGMFNTTVTSMRGLVAATRFKKIKSICPHKIAPSSFSEAQHLFSPEVLAEVIRDLAAQAKGMVEFGNREVRQAVETLTAVDGTVLRALNRMSWAPAAGFGCGVRLNLQFSVFDQVPLDWSITPSHKPEVKEWKKRCKRGAFYVGDRLYGADHLWLKQLQKKGVDFVVRFNGNVWRKAVGSARELTEADHNAGIVSDQIVELGCRGGGPILRVIEIKASDQTILLATTREDLSAELIGQIYSYRWQIELFFKWLKTMLPCKHWMAESASGVTIQIYCAMIAALLLLLWTGQRPTKRQMEALRFYWSGFIDEEELLEVLSSQKIQ